MTRMYYKTLDTGAGAADDNIKTVDNLSPYTTGRSVSDIIEQIRPFIPNIQRLFAELLDE
jgi:hypothetical protein